MYGEEEKQAQAQVDMLEKLKASGQMAGMLGKSTGEPCRPSLRDRVASQLRRSNDEVARSMRLAELQHLLDKNPEVARILDLVEEVRG